MWAKFEWHVAKLVDEPEIVLKHFQLLFCGRLVSVQLISYTYPQIGLVYK